MGVQAKLLRVLQERELERVGVDAILPRRLAPRIAEASPELRDDYLQALESTGWVIEGKAGAAARLGLHPNTLRHRMKRLGIARPEK